MPAEAVVSPPSPPSEAMRTFHWDETAKAIVKDIEHAIIPLDLDCQGQFIALTNAIEMQLEAPVPVPDVVRLLGDAVLALAHARALPHTTRRDLATSVGALNDRLRTTARNRSAR
jgi:hypothetical protein